MQLVRFPSLKAENKVQCFWRSGIKLPRRSHRNISQLFFLIILVFVMYSRYSSNKTHHLREFHNVTEIYRKPLIVVVTPTYKRPTRLADLTRMANTVRQVEDLHWIVVEDSDSEVVHVDRILNRTGLAYTYLAAKTIDGFPKRGWYQRTVALNYIRKNRKDIMGKHTEGVLYFGDDDNAYDLRLFNNYVRNVEKLGLWAVGMVGETAVESLNVVEGKFVGFNVKWNPARKFAVDMAGFGINLRVIFNSTAVFGTSCTRGQNAPETCLLEDLGLTRADIEPFGYENEVDRELMVWHTKTLQPHYNLSEVDLNGYVFENSPPEEMDQNLGQEYGLSALYMRLNGMFTNRILDDAFSSLDKFKYSLP